MAKGFNMMMMHKPGLNLGLTFSDIFYSVIIWKPHGIWRIFGKAFQQCY